MWPLHERDLDTYQIICSNIPKIKMITPLSCSLKTYYLNNVSETKLNKRGRYFMYVVCNNSKIKVRTPNLNINKKVSKGSNKISPFLYICCSYKK